MYGSNAFDRLMQEVEAKARQDEFLKNRKSVAKRSKKNNRNYLSKKTKMKHIQRRKNR